MALKAPRATRKLPGNFDGACGEIDVELPPRPAQQQPPRWKPLVAIDRRVVGVLVEKAKTTPDAYPMSVNALRAGCNQKNNRSPLMELEQEDVEESLERLRAVGAVTEVQGGGRVLRYRHHMYEWLGVDKIELGVMAELLLRGAQTEGELRGRAARMDPIADVAALRPVLTSLRSKGLIISLTPEGRGHVLTHALYEPRELEKLRADFKSGNPEEIAGQGSVARSGATTPPATGRDPAHSRLHSPDDAEKGTANRALQSDETVALRAEVASVRSDLDAMREEVNQLRKDLEELWSQLR